MASVTALSGGIASMRVACAAGAGVSRRAVVAHVGAGNGGGAVGFGASALLGKDTSSPCGLGLGSIGVTAGTTRQLAVGCFFPYRSSAASAS